MKPIIVLQKRKPGIRSKNIAVISLLVICIFFIQSSLFPQVELDTTGKTNKTENDIIIHQEIDFKVTPQQLYHALLSSKEFSDCIKKSFNNFTEKSASIDSIVGGTFSLFDGHIIGRILELIPNQRIVEAWRVVDWPSGVYSIAKFEFKPQGSSTHLIFDHIGFPAGLKEHLSIGWQQHYWDALSKYFE